MTIIPTREGGSLNIALEGRLDPSLMTIRKPGIGENTWSL